MKHDSPSKSDIGKTGGAERVFLQFQGVGSGVLGIRCLRFRACGFRVSGFRVWGLGVSGLRFSLCLLHMLPISSCMHAHVHDSSDCVRCARVYIHVYRYGYLDIMNSVYMCIRTCVCACTHIEGRATERERQTDNARSYVTKLGRLPEVARDKDCRQRDNRIS